MEHLCTNAPTLAGSVLGMLRGMSSSQAGGVGLVDGYFPSLCSGVEFSSSVEEFSSYFLSVPYLGLHLAFSWEICLSALLTLLFVLFAEDLEVHVLLILLTNLLPRPRPLV